jgi:hypothetical protein
LTARTISSYLRELDRQLRARRAPRGRLLREVDDHLRESSAELMASSVPRAEAEAEAVARFGAAAAVASSFAEAAASTTAQRAAGVAAGALFAYGAVFCVFAMSASPLVRDFPQGMPSFFGIQLAGVALAVGLTRSLRWRTEAAAPRGELIFIARALALACGSLAASALVEASLALARPAGVVVWSEAPYLTVGFAAASAIVLFAAFAAVRAAARTAALGALPVDDGGEAPVAMLRDDLLVLAARLRLRRLPPIRTLDPLTHPWRLTLSIAALAFAAVTAGQLASGGAQHASALPEAALLGLLEAGAIVASFAAFSRLLGLRNRVGVPRATAR